MISIADMMKRSGVHFGTSGVRGRVADMTDEVCWVYTAGFIQYLQAKQQITKGDTIAIAGDLRSSTDRMMKVLAQAIVDKGYVPVNLGTIPSPAIALYGIEHGIATMMVTGSHTPEDRNGIKFNTASGEILKEDEAGIRNQVVTYPEGKFTPAGVLPEIADLPAVNSAANLRYIQRYIDFLPPKALAGLSIGLYEHSSVSRECLYEILTGLGARVMRLGRTDAFISVDTEAIRPEDVVLAAQWSNEHGFDCIISTDGDGDRPLISDEKGVWLRGDVAGILCAQYLAADAVITPVNCNSALELSKWFTYTQRTQIGLPFVIAGMVEAAAEYQSVIGYEANGGVLVGSEIVKGERRLAPLPTRDAAIVPLAILMLAKECSLTISALLKSLPERYTISNRLKDFPTESSTQILSPFLTLPLEDSLKSTEQLLGALAGVPVALNTTDGVRLTFESGDIIHFRPSGNAPELRCYTESATESRAVALNASCIALMESWRVAKLSVLVKHDLATRRLYATDASVYEELPESVAFPKNTEECISLVKDARKNKTPLIFRAAGTSIAGQCVGGGQVVDVSRFLTGILGKPKGHTIKAQPGVIHSDLDCFLKPFNLKFAPEISTSNRCMIGGMIGNNAAGSHSVAYGTTREYVIAIEALLSDGSVVEFGPMTDDELSNKCRLKTLEGEIYRTVTDVINQHRTQILKRYPKPEIIRRNTGYPLDVLAKGQPWVKSGRLFNLAPFLCGTEGTLAFTLSATLKLVEIPKSKGLACIHFSSLEQAMVATPVILKHQPAAIELMDKRLLALTENHIAHRRNRQWIEGAPEAVLAVEFLGDSDSKIAACFKKLIADLKQCQLGYAYPVISTADAAKVWAIRKASLGLLMGVGQRKKPVAVIEDSAVAPSDLSAYTKAISAIMAREKINCVYYGHASVGLLHLRPELDLAKAEDRLLFTALAEQIADLVKSFNGSLSGEHGDGRLRGPFLEKMVGAELYKAHGDIKKAFDPDAIFNPGKILTTEPIDQPLRVAKSDLQWQGETGFDWSGDLGLPAVVEKCNGAAICRKSAGDGALCPSYHATGEELYNTRGRSNLLRFLLRSGRDFKQELLDPGLVQSMDYCLSCKACQSECPASVDMARLKAEYLYQRRLAHGLSFKDRMVRFYPYYLRWGSVFPALTNKLQDNVFFKKIAGVSPQRQLPTFAAVPFAKGVEKGVKATSGEQNVILLVDIFTQVQSPQIAEDAVTVLKAASLTVHPVLMKTSPRQLISQGLLAEARAACQQLLRQIKAYPKDFLIVGLEPSELLVLRDEAVDLVKAKDKEQVEEIKGRAFLLEEFLAQKVLANSALGNLFKTTLKKEPVAVAIHTHCHQKAQVGLEPTKTLFNALPGVQFKHLNTGCCGMAGQFGYENPKLSEQVAKTSFLPAITGLEKETVLIAAGCSCRPQATVLANRKALHPATFLAGRL